jgi:glycosyltransferase involved in cell wall biosynthesis
MTINSNKYQWSLSNFEHIFAKPEVQLIANTEISLVVLLRVRNEELILRDTLDHLSTFADFIVAYEDASIDNTRLILRSHPKVVLIIEEEGVSEDVKEDENEENFKKTLKEMLMMTIILRINLVFLYILLEEVNIMITLSKSMITISERKK